MSVEVFESALFTGEVLDLHGTAPADLLHGEELPPSTVDEARERSERIRAGLVLYVETRAAIAEAWARRDWKTLGYDNWDAYLAGEFGDQLRKLMGAERREAVAQYREVGMSTRAIASAVQAPQSTVADDVRQLTGSGQLPETIKSLDGKERPAKREPKPAEPPLADPPTRDRPAEDKPAEPERPAPPPATSRGDAETERLARQRTETVSKALISLWGQIGDDPIGWLERTWRPGVSRTHGIQAVADALGPAGLRRTGNALLAMADKLEENGDTL